MTGTLRRRTARPASQLGAWQLAAAAVLLLTAAAVLLEIASGTSELLPSLVLMPLFLACSAPAIRLLQRSRPAFDLAGILTLGIALKLFGTLARYDVINRLYGGVGDATVYDFHGARLAEEFRAFNFAVDAGQRIPGTGSVRYLTGLVYALVGSTQFSGFLVFSLLSFWGTVFLYLAFVTALPAGNHRRYALVLFLWPSLLFWPSSIGKEAVIIFCLGLAAWGAARLFVRARAGMLLVALGTTGLVLIRPHVALLAFVPVFAGYVIRPTRQTPLSGITKVGGIVVLLVAGAVLTAQVERFFDLDRLDASSLEGVLAGTEDRTTAGDSEFTAARVRTPLDLPAATVTVLVRPLPFEVRNATMALSALEGLALGTYLAISWRSLARSVRRAATEPYVAFALVFSLLFIIAFSSISNFGILARQRVQLLPFLFVLTALPARHGPDVSLDADERDAPRWRTSLWDLPVGSRQP